MTTTRMRTLLPMAADGVGPSLTCVRLAEGLHHAGIDIDVMVNRTRMDPQPEFLRPLVPRPFARVPHRYAVVSEPLSRVLEARYLASLQDDDIAWLWPSVSLRTHEIVKERGIPIILEGINTRMGQAKAILDTAYDVFGAPPSHGITDLRISEENQKIQQATTIFAPSTGVEQGLKGTSLESCYIPSSYGTTVEKDKPASTRDADGQVVFLFCGYACVRKGVHHLLDIWPHMPRNAVLKLVGRIEPVIAERYRHVLDTDRVICTGFTRDVATHYASSDVFVFPSLEEGDPLVTYEAAVHALPIVASKQGAGRISAETGCSKIIEPADYEMFLSTLEALYASREERVELGRMAHRAVQNYDWNAIGAKRAADMESFFERKLRQDQP